MTERFLLPTDFSEAAAVGVQHGAELARRLGADVTLAHVWDATAMGEPPATLGWTPSKQEQLVAEVRAHLQGLLDRAKSDIGEDIEVKIELLEHHSPATALADYADANGMDQIVVATHGRTGVSRLLLGSVAEKIVRLAPCPVLTVPVRD